MSTKTLQERFFSDPEWFRVEELIKEYIDPLLDMSTIDITQPAEAVKAELVGRLLAHKSLSDFIEQSKLVGHARPKVEDSPFR